MTLEEIEAELKHLATKEELQALRADMEKGFKEQLKWIIVLQIPNWVGIVGILTAILLHR